VNLQQPFWGYLKVQWLMYKHCTQRVLGFIPAITTYLSNNQLKPRLVGACNTYRCGKTPCPNFVRW